MPAPVASATTSAAPSAISRRTGSTGSCSRLAVDEDGAARDVVQPGGFEGEKSAVEDDKREAANNAKTAARTLSVFQKTSM